VIAWLSTTTSRGDPLPTLVGLDWLLQPAEDATSPYYHHLDTPQIGALGHSEGGMSTCKAAADPRIVAIGTISGTTTATYNSMTTEPAMFMDNLAADRGGLPVRRFHPGGRLHHLTTPGTESGARDRVGAEPARALHSRIQLTT
jgi:hypothetical protein